ncbi:hypothetical protein VPHD51_0224 [Vibrio phage D51]
MLTQVSHYHTSLTLPHKNRLSHRTHRAHVF